MIIAMQQQTAWMSDRPYPWFTSFGVRWVWMIGLNEVKACAIETSMDIYLPRVYNPYSQR